MGPFETSLMMGFLLGAISVLVVKVINSRFARQEKKTSLLLLKRARRD